MSPAHFVTIDEALCSLGEIGHVRLVVEKGRLRFMVTWNSCDAVKWQRGLIDCQHEIWCEAPADHLSPARPVESIHLYPMIKSIIWHCRKGGACIDLFK